MTKSKRGWAIFTAVAVLFVMLFSVFYIAMEANHHCIGDECPVCQQIVMCENAVNNLSLALVFVAVVTAIFLLKRHIELAFISVCKYATLVTLKVKLTN